MKPAEKIRIFQQAFSGRTDVVARYWKSKDGKRAGYSPICSNEWKKDVCQKVIQKRCHDCPNASYVPLSATLFLEHFQGKHILGCYPLLEDNTVNFIACDLDDHSGGRNPLSDLRRLYDVCSVQEVPLHALRSKSGKGYHAYLFFSSPVPAWKARGVYFAILREAQVIGEEAELSSFDKLIPDQPNLEGKKFGNLIALPFQGQAVKHGHTLFLDPIEFKTPVEDQWEHLQTMRRWTEADLDRLIEEWNLTIDETQKNKNESGNPAGWITQALRGVVEGARDDTGMKLAGYLRRKAIPDDIAFEMLNLWNTRNQPPLEPYQIKKLISSASRYSEHGDGANGRPGIKVSFE